jgi:hypothetical protein
MDLIDSLDISPEKKKWIEQYAQNHLAAEKNPVPEIALNPTIPNDLTHFEIHPAMKEMWKSRKTI